MIKIPIKPNAIDSTVQSARGIIVVLPFAVPEIENFQLKTADQRKSADYAASDHIRVENKDIIVLDSEVLDLSVVTSKDGAHTLSASIAPGSSYLEKINPGDHILAWITSNDEKYEELKNQLLKLQQSGQVDNSHYFNGINSGLKFVGQVRQISENFTVGTKGSKKRRYQLAAAGFLPYSSQVMLSLFATPSGGGTGWSVVYKANFLNQGNPGDEDATKYLTSQGLIEGLHKTFFSKGVSDTISGEASPNTIIKKIADLFLIPPVLNTILGGPEQDLTNPGYLSILNVLIGVQKYQGDNSLPFNLEKDPEGSLYTANNNKKDWLKGSRLFNVTPNMNGDVGSLMKENLNGIVNEMYLTLRYNPLEERIIPTAVFRQIPFTKNTTTLESFNYTKFIDLPAWDLPLSMISAYNLSKNDQLRTNSIFIRPFAAIDIAGRAQPVTDAINLAQNGVFFDPADIKRNGLRMYQASLVGDILLGEKEGSPIDKVGKYSALVSDFLSNMHLKLTGSVSCVGIQDAIPVGDNLKIGNRLFHIESVSHNYRVESTGITSFRTDLILSHGVFLNEDETDTLDYTTKIQFDVDENGEVIATKSASANKDERQADEQIQNDKFGPGTVLDKKG